LKKAVTITREEHIFITGFCGQFLTVLIPSEWAYEFSKQ
jgi:hypothetical protein